MSPRCFLIRAVGKRRSTALALRRRALYDCVALGRYVMEANRTCLGRPSEVTSQASAWADGSLGEKTRRPSTGVMPDAKHQPHPPVSSASHVVGTVAVQAQRPGIPGMPRGGKAPHAGANSL